MTSATTGADTSAEAAGRKPKKRRGAYRVARGPGAETAEPGSEPVHLSAADLRPVAQGDELSTPDVLRLDMSNDKELPELSQDQIDEPDNRGRRCSWCRRGVGRSGARNSDG